MKLTELKTNKTAVVEDILGGDNMKHRLESLGLITGKEFMKVSSHFWQGPVTIKLKYTGNKVAIGHGMAEKIIVREITA